MILKLNVCLSPVHPPPSRLNKSALPTIKRSASLKQMKSPLSFLKDKQKEENVCALEGMDHIWRRRSSTLDIGQTI